MPRLGALNRDNPRAFAKDGDGDSNPYSGDTHADPLTQPGKYSSYGYPVGPEEIATRHRYAGMIHMELANQEQASGRYFGLKPKTDRPIITPTSYIFAAPPPITTPSEFHPGVILPDWLEAY